MKLSEHVEKLRILIEGKFDKQFARLGLGKTKPMDLASLPESLHPKRQRYSAIIENHIGETGDYVRAREKLLDELTFTLFNRFAAVKVMEAASLFPPVLTRQPEHGDRSFGHKAWLEIYPDMRNEELEGIREYIKVAFDELGETLPLYSRKYPYALLPDAFSLNDIIEAFNAVEKDPQVGPEIWQSDDILGWLYESYNNAKKAAFKESKAKTEYDKVAIQSQVYTPRWVVQFLVENSLGKLYLEMYPDSEIKRRYKIANAPQTQERKPKPLHEVKAIDPACGSGNFLLYAFDFFYELYVDQIDNYGVDYDEKDISKLIIENNLHGIDLDDRAVQLAQLGLFIKAKKKRRTIGELAFNVVSSDFYLPEYETVEHIFTKGTTLDKSQQKLIAEIWNDLQYAYKFGSLIRLDEKVKAKLKMLEAKQSSAQPELFAAMEIAAHRDFAATFFTNLKTAVEQYAQAQGNTFLTSKTRDAITFLELLTTEYDVATANPPYTDTGDFGKELKAFIEGNYKKPYKFHTNLYATFLKRCCDLTNVDGKIAMIHPNTFMFIKSFEGVRNYILNKLHIDLLVDYGLDRANLFGGDILLDSNSFYVLSKNKKDEKSIFFNIAINQQEKFKKDSLLSAQIDVVNGVENNRVSYLNQSKFDEIESKPFIYWISDGFREKFSEAPLHKVANVVSGVKTGNNNGALRLWWELNKEDIFTGENKKKWVQYTKGGKFRKWHGNNWLCVDWRNDCDYIKRQNSFNLPSEQYSFVEGINYSGSGQKGVCFRYLEKNVLYDMGSSAVFPKFNLLYAIAILNSKLVFYISDCLNPTVNKQPNDVKRIPLPPPTEKNIEYLSPFSKKNKGIYKYLERYSILEVAFEKSPLESFFENDTKRSIKRFLNHENHLLAQVLISEAIINQKVFEIYNLTRYDKTMVISQEGESIGGLPVTSEARNAYLSETEATKEFTLDAIREFIEELPTKEFPHEEREAIEEKFPSLYQKNNDLEEFCIHHQVNPINVWYWFKLSSVIPQQRMHTLAMEFLADMIREILMEDEDGIIPLVPNAGKKILLDRIEEKFREKGFSTAQYAGFDTVLGRSVQDYLNRFFFAELSDHLNLFMYLPKTPFIWHLSSGPEQGFDCYIIIYKWSRDKLLRLRSVYIENRERSLVNRQSDLAENKSAEAQTEKDRIFKQLKEIESFKAKIDDLLSEGYDPILDDGVGKNIAPLQKRKMIPYDVLNPGQLKKYLNADW
jgi:hypothetical protein